MEYMNICAQLRRKLKEATERNKADAILLSGGLDTSILAFIARPSIGFTVALKNSPAPDLKYSEKVARLLNIELREIRFSVEEALNTLPEVIRILKTFDLALPNDLSIYFALKLAKESKFMSVMTGDGSDELFAGYSYMAELSPKELERYIRRLSENWHFSATELGKALGIEVKQPFLNEDFVRFALDISPELKVSPLRAQARRVKEGMGKYILRRSFEDLIPPEIVWREKEPIECGSGSSKLRGIINNMVSDKEFQSAREKTGIKFINKEHFFYYQIYNKVVGEIPKAESNEGKCPCCGAKLITQYCRICGFSYPLEKCL